jgi:hypothetical protein
MLQFGDPSSPALVAANIAAPCANYSSCVPLIIQSPMPMQQFDYMPVVFVQPTVVPAAVANYSIVPVPIGEVQDTWDQHYDGHVDLSALMEEGPR